MSSLSEADSSSPIIIDVSGERTNGDDLKFNDVTYVWLERSLRKDSEAFVDNNAILTVNYFTA